MQVVVLKSPKCLRGLLRRSRRAAREDRGRGGFFCGLGVE